METTLRFHLTPIKCLRLKIQVTAHAGEDVEEEEDSYIASGIAKWYNNSGKQSDGSTENWK